MRRNCLALAVSAFLVTSISHAQTTHCPSGYKGFYSFFYLELPAGHLYQFSGAPGSLWSNVSFTGYHQTGVDTGMHG